MLHPGQELTFGKDGAQQAVILANGHLRCGESTGSFHHVAKMLHGAPCNGWEHWYFVDAATGERQALDRLRERYPAERGDTPAEVD